MPRFIFFFNRVTSCFRRYFAFGKEDGGGGIVANGRRYF